MKMKLDKRSLWYTIQNMGDSIIIYTKTSKEEDWEFCVSYPVKEVDGGSYIHTNLISKLIELANFGYRQVP